jgi:hypothetical protein
MTLSPLETLLAFAGALALFLAPIDSVKHFSEISGILFTLVVCILIYLLLLFVFKNNSVIAHTMLLSMVFYAIKYIALCINSSYYYIHDNSLTFGITFFDVISYGLILFVPCVIATSIHLINLKTTYQSPHIIKEFVLFFKVAIISFYIFYVILLTGKIIFNVPIGTIENPSFSLIPFANMASGTLVSHSIIGILLFVPLGFTFSIYLKWINIFAKLLFTILFSSIIALTMYLLGTYNIDTNFLLFAVAGYFIGLLIKISFDKIYSIWLGIPGAKVIYTDNKVK